MRVMDVAEVSCYLQLLAVFLHVLTMIWIILGGDKPPCF